MLCTCSFLSFADKYSRNVALQRTLASSSSSFAAPTAGLRACRAPPPPRRTDGCSCDQGLEPGRGGGRESTGVMSTTSSLSDPPNPPIIVLHEAPVLLLQRPAAAASVGNVAEGDPPSWANCMRRQHNHHHLPMHTRRTSRRRRDSVHLLQEGDYPEMLLSPGTLETIVIHNGAYFVQGVPPPPHPPTLQPSHGGGSQSQPLQPMPTGTYDSDGGLNPCTPPAPTPPDKTTLAPNRTGLTTGHQ